MASNMARMASQTLILPAVKRSLKDPTKEAINRLNDTFTNKLEMAMRALKDGAAWKKLEADMTSGPNAATVVKAIEDDLREQSRNATNALFYAVEACEVDAVKFFLDHGADPNCCFHTTGSRKGSNKSANGMPLLVFATLRWPPHHSKTIDIFKMLLSYGASPHCIPEHMWSATSTGSSVASNNSAPCEPDWEFPSRALSPSAESSECKVPSEPEMQQRPKRHDMNLNGSTNHLWFHSHRNCLEEALTISHRYWLQRASKFQTYTRQFGAAFDMTNTVELKKMPFRFHGQDKAIMTFTRALVSQYGTRRHRGSSNWLSETLVMMFTGSDGCGKSLLVEAASDLLDLPLFEFNLASKNASGNIRGVASNNSIESSTDVCGSSFEDFVKREERGIICIKDFDKASWQMQKWVLQVLRYGLVETDSYDVKSCHDFIFILCCSFKPPNMYTGDLEVDSSEAQWVKAIRSLRSTAYDLFGVPLASRIKHIVPFIPFSEEQAMAIAHEWILTCKAYVAEKALFEPFCVGRLNLIFKDEESVVRHVVDQSRPWPNVQEIRRIIDDVVDGDLVALFCEDKLSMTAAVNTRPMRTFQVSLIQTEDEERLGIEEIETSMLPTEDGEAS